MMYNIKYFNRKKIKNIHLSKILNWRNNINIRKQMINNRLINLKEHKEWFLKNEKSKDNFLNIITYKKFDIAYLNIKKINKKKKMCTYGMYINPKLIKSGLGIFLQFYCVNLIFNEYKFNKICGKVKNQNINMIKIHRLFGFKIVKKKYCNFYYVYQNKNNWNIKKRLFEKKFNSFILNFK